MYLYYASIFTVLMAFFGCIKEKSHPSHDGVKNASLVKKSIVKPAPLIPLDENTKTLSPNAPTTLDAPPEIESVSTSDTPTENTPAFNVPKDENDVAPNTSKSETATVLSDSITSTEVATTESTTSAENSKCETKGTTISSIQDYTQYSNGFTVACGETVTWSFNGSFDDNTGIITVKAGGTLNITGNMTLIGTINNNGTITISNRVGWGLENKNTINNNGTITISNPNWTGLYNSGNINNNGVIAISNTPQWGLYIEYGSIKNNGTITISNTDGFGLYNFNGTINNNTGGTITVSNTGGTGLYNLNGTISNVGGTITKTDSGTCTGCPI